MSSLQLNQPLLPDKRWQLLRDEKKGEDPLVDSFLAGSVSPAFYEATRLRSRPLKKSYVEACLLATSDVYEISSLLEIPEEVLEMYRLFFFDLTGFDHLDKLELLSSCDEPNEYTLKTWALTQGLDFLTWRLGKNSKISPVEGLEGLFRDCLFKSKEALYAKNSEIASKESVKWVKLSMDAARLVKMWVTDSNAAMKDIELALKTVNPEFGTFDEIAREEEGLTLNIQSVETIFPGLGEEKKE